MITIEKKAELMYLINAYRDCYAELAYLEEVGNAEAIETAEHECDAARDDLKRFIDREL